MDELDLNLIKDLRANSRVSYAELGRKYNLSRVCIRERINNLVEEGVIQRFTIDVDHSKLGKNLHAFFDIEVKPNTLYKIAEELIEEDHVTGIILLTGSTTIYLDALLEGKEELELFLRDKLYSRDDILRVTTRIMLKRYTKIQKGESA